jgi:hypothetical protein
MPPRRVFRRLALASLPAIATLWAAACLPTRPEGDVHRITDDPDAGNGAGGAVPFTPDPSNTGSGGTTVEDPHGVSTVVPDHGRFSGGVRVILQGSGFAQKPRVWFGEVEVDAKDVTALSPKKLQITTPPGAPGVVDVSVQNGADSSTRRVLAKAFTYDTFYADPPSGPTSGGTVVKILGQGTTWGSETHATIGQKPCLQLDVISPTELSCVAPPYLAGARSVTVTEGDAPLAVLDAYTYADSDDGFKGGLSGNTLPAVPAMGMPAAGALRVLAFDSYQGTPLTGAKVYLGASSTPAGVIDATGVALLQNVVQPDTMPPPMPDPMMPDTTPAPKPGRVTVTVARKCSQPTTFVAVGVDTVTMYLDPILSPDCSPPDGDPPPVGGKPGASSQVQGEVIFPSTAEFKRGPWTSIPMPVSEDERKVTYLFTAAGDPKQTFRLPDVSQAITEDAAGGAGYGFAIPSAPIGNLTIYALGGIENRKKNPPTFVAYVFGVARGVATQPGQQTSDVAIPLDLTLDQAVTLTLDPPIPSSKGPDRVQASVAVNLGNAGYAIFPGAQRSQPLPLSGNLSFVGLPPLLGTLDGASYVSSAQAATGANLGLPVSVVSSVATTSASQVATLDGFLRVPQLVTPSEGAWDGVTYKLSVADGGPTPDLFVLDIESGGGLVGWTVATPGDTPSFTLPDLRTLPGGGLVPGPLSITVSAARAVPTTGALQFSYDALRYKHLNTGGWLAYARDSFFTQLPP